MPRIWASLDYQSLRGLYGRAMLALARESRRSIWAFVDQGVVSFGNFAIVLLLGRFGADHRISLDDVGAFAVLFEVMLLLNGVQAALVIYPLTLAGASAGRRAVGRLTSIGLAATFLGAPLVMVVTGAACLLNRGPTAHVNVVLAAAAAVLAWQVQETTRRALMSELRFGAAIFGDTISYVGQAAGALLLGEYGHLSLAGIYAIMALTSTVAAAIQCLQIHPRKFSAQEFTAAARDGWRLGRWQLSGNAASQGAASLYAFNIRYWAGLSLTAVHSQINNLFRFANPLGVAVSTLILPHAAREHAEKGMPGATKVSLRIALFGALPLSCYLGFLFIFPHFALDLAYKKGNPYQQYAFLVRIIAVNIALIFMATVTGSLLNAVGRSRRSFIGQLGYAAGFLLIGMPLTSMLKLLGAAIGGLVGALAQAGLNSIGIRQAWRDAKAGLLPPVTGVFPEAAGMIAGASGAMSVTSDLAEPAGAH